MDTPFLQSDLSFDHPKGNEPQRELSSQLESPFLNEHVNPNIQAREQENPALEDFGSDEHRSFADGAVQAMVDSWARDGLIEGGAFIATGATDDTRALPLANWNIWVETPPPKNSGARWHWIAPNALTDSTGQRWTATSLRQAIAEGRAVCLTIGQVVMMAGDLSSSFDELRFGGPTTVQSIMKGYDDRDPLAWTLLRVKLLAELDTAYDKTGLGILPDSMEQGLAARRLIFTAKNRYAEMRAHINSRSHGWFRLKLAVDFLRSLRRGSHGHFHVLAQLLSHAKPSLTVRILRDACPWMSEKQFITLENILKSVDADMLQTVLSNGAYSELALKNQNHFAPQNWIEFETHQAQALNQIAHAAAQSTPGAIPADAVARCAFGLHFLTDAFASGHMRTPRAILGPGGSLAAKIMHDVDNQVGLYVTNGLGASWIAVGDGRIKKSSSRLPRRGPSDGPLLHRNKIQTATLLAMKQLVVHAINRHRLLGSGLLKFRNYPESALYNSDGHLGTRTLEDNTPIFMSAQLKKHRPIPTPWGRWPIAIKGRASPPPLIKPDGTANSNDYEITGTKSAWITAIGFDGADLLNFTDYYLLAFSEPSHASAWAPSQDKSRQIFEKLESWNPIRDGILKGEVASESSDPSKSDAISMHKSDSSLDSDEFGALDSSESDASFLDNLDDPTFSAKAEEENWAEDSPVHSTQEPDHAELDSYSESEADEDEGFDSSFEDEDSLNETPKAGATLTLSEIRLHLYLPIPNGHESLLKYLEYAHGGYPESAFAQLGIALSLFSDTTTAVTDFTASLQVPGAVVIYMGHTRLVVNKKSKSIVGGGLNPKNEKTIPLSRKRLAELLRKSKCSMTILAGCASNKIVRRGQSSNSIVVTTESGNNLMTNSALWSRAFTSLLYSLVGWRFDGKKVTLRPEGKNATVDEAIVEAKPLFNGEDTFVLSIGNGNAKIP
jgi:hypothetical protein